MRTLLRRPRTSWPNVILGALVVGVAAALVVVLVRGAGTSPAAAAASSRDIAVRAAATAETEAFLHVDYRRMGPLAQRVLAGATGSFRSKYAATQSQLTAAATSARAVSIGTVREVGVSEASATSATVFVAADAVVTNTKTGSLKATKACPHRGAACRYYRLKLTLRSVGGAWKMADVEYVS